MNLTLTEGDSDAGYYKEITASEFITGDDLATSLGLTAGTSINSNTDWLIMSSGDNVVYVAKKPIRYGLSWDDLDNVGGDIWVVNKLR